MPAAAGAGTQGKLAKWTDNSGTLGDSIVSEANGFIGIGTNSPGSLLTVQGVIPAHLGLLQTIRTTGSNNGFGLMLDSTGTGNNNLGLSVNGERKGGFGFDVGRNFIGYVNSLHNGGQDFSFRLNADGSFTYHDSSVYPGPERFRVTSTGRVGIGNPDPQAALDVVGDMRVSGNAVVAGNIAAKYQDVAEWVPARQKITPGTVVILDVTRSNGVEPSHLKYDTHVAGVVSAQPGLILGEGGEGQVLVATTGRVKVMVDATRHSVKIGDLLVTSDTPGSAMKSVPVRVAGNRLHRPGTIIGKALEPLSGGKGEILVLLSMQ
ncbi:MAG: hypothetical protein LC785_04955 [Acidobacteria bacterium]|nr:hypothetical protein [Acidobacteriota bacterium]